jgi:hypothetical protein
MILEDGARGVRKSQDVLKCLSSFELKARQECDKLFGRVGVGRATRVE